LFQFQSISCLQNLFQFQSISYLHSLFQFQSITYLHSLFQFTVSQLQGRDSSVGIVTRILGGPPRNRSSIVGRSKNLCLLQFIHTGSEAHQLTYWMDNAGSLPGVKQSRRGT
jgi:hypothetical protein